MDGTDPVETVCDREQRKSPPTMRVPDLMNHDAPGNGGPLSAPCSAAAPELLCDGAFVSDEQLARLVESGAAVRIGAVLVSAGGEQFARQDALRILGVEPGKTDPYGLTGRVSSLVSLLERGFVLYAARVALGRHLYDIELGVILHAIDSPSTLPSGRPE